MCLKGFYICGMESLASILIHRELYCVERNINNFRDMIYRIENGEECCVSKEELLKRIDDAYKHIDKRASEIRKQFPY